MLAGDLALETTEGRWSCSSLHCNAFLAKLCQWGLWKYQTPTSQGVGLDNLLCSLLDLFFYDFLYDFQCCHSGKWWSHDSQTPFTAATLVFSAGHCCHNKVGTAVVVAPRVDKSLSHSSYKSLPNILTWEEKGWAKAWGLWGDPSCLSFPQHGMKVACDVKGAVFLRVEVTNPGVLAEFQLELYICAFPAALLLHIWIPLVMQEENQSL